MMMMMPTSDDDDDEEAEASGDDLEDEYELVLRGKKADLIEVANVLHTGIHAKRTQQAMTPPDCRMMHDLVEDLGEMLDVTAANDAMEQRLLEGNGYIVGETVEADLQRVEDANE